MNFIRSLLDGIVFRVAMYILRRRVVMHLGHFGGLRHFPQSGPAIIVANHESYFDSFVIAGLVWLLHGRRVWVPTKVKAFRGLLQGLLHRALGGVPIDPQHPDDAYKTVGAILNKGDVILMFPEGKRSEIREGLLPFHWGAFNLAARFDVPVIPVAVRGTRRVLPKGRRWFVEREKASVWVGPLQMSRAKPAQSKDLETRASAGVIRKSCESMIQQVVSADESRMSRQRGPEARWLSEFIDSRIEHLLEGGVEQITARQASDVMALASLGKTLVDNSRDFHLQYLRAYGFWIRALPRLLAVWFLSGFRQQLLHTLRSAGGHPYAYYCLGQYHLQVPRIFGGHARHAHTALRIAYDNAHRFGYDPAKFAVAYAMALARENQNREAMAIIAKHFDIDPNESPRMRRRRARAMRLWCKLN